MTETNDTEFSDPRLVVLYDTLNPFGDDSEFFCKQAEKLAAKTIIDLGCGTGLVHNLVFTTLMCRFFTS